MTKNPKQLAIFGGEPAFSEKVHVGRPNIGGRDRLMERIGDMLSHRWLTNRGPYVVEFEETIARMVGVKHCIAMCNATIALEILARAADLKGEVIVPSYTFVATAHALQWQKITPVFCDVDPATHNIDPRKVERMITPRTTGIIGVHLWGRPCAIEELTEIARHHGLTLLFDAAHAFGCSFKGRMIGSFGRAEVFSFHATKFVNSFEGGAVLTNDDDLAEKIRLMQNFGFVDYDEVIYIGTNGKMTEVCAAMGLTSIEAAEGFVEINRRNYRGYQRGLHGLPGISLLKHNGNEKCNYQYVVIDLDETVVGITRDEVIGILHAEGILARRYFHPGVHRMEPYASYFPHAGLLLPETEALADRVIVLPTGTAVDLESIDTICCILHTIIGNASTIREMLPARAKNVSV